MKYIPYCKYCKSHLTLLEPYFWTAGKCFDLDLTCHTKCTVFTVHSALSMK
jgi:hypothetical protein